MGAQAYVPDRSDNIVLTSEATKSLSVAIKILRRRLQVARLRRFAVHRITLSEVRTAIYQIIVFVAAQLLYIDVKKTLCLTASTTECYYFKHSERIAGGLMPEIQELCQTMLGCQECGLSKSRTRVVPGEGPDNPQIVFIGEAPGWQEDQQGRPFVGPAGQFLNQLLASAGLKREDVYICNVVKCRPPNNRDPLPTEMAACKHWLDAQLELLKPRVVVTLGRYSLGRYFPGESIGKIHGKHVERDGVIYFPMYHPAAALHQGSLRATIEDDMKKLAALLDDAPSKREEKAEEAPTQQQLSMF